MKKLVKKIASFFKKLFSKHRKIPAPKGFEGETQYWYGRVNYWTYSEKILEKEIKLMRYLGISGYIIELSSWHEGGDDQLKVSQPTDNYRKCISQIEKAYVNLHKLCIENGLWLFVGIVNDNVLSNKHGNKAADPKGFYKYAANDLLNIVLKDGNQNIIVQPIGELYNNRVSNHPGPAWQKNAVAKLKAAGFLTCNNNEYGTPENTAGMNFMAWHPSRISSLPSKANKKLTFIISDSGGIISELNGGTNCDKLDADCKPSKVHEWRNKCNGYAVCGYYDLQRRSFNEVAIKAMAGK